jgi:RHS repeat-associated protein
MARFHRQVETRYSIGRDATQIISPTGEIVEGQIMTTLVHSAYNARGQKNYLYPANFNNELHRFGYNARWGYRTDTETGLAYCQNRYYDPANGRWVTRDPIGYAGGVNLYGYCGSGPVGFADWLGLWKAVIIMGDQGGGACLMGGVSYWSWLRWLHRMGATEVTVLHDPTEQEIIDALSDPEVGGFVFIGHGTTKELSASPAFPLAGDDTFDSATIARIAKNRKGRKMRVGVLFACYSRGLSDELGQITYAPKTYAGAAGYTDLFDKPDVRKGKIGGGAISAGGGGDRPRTVFAP